MWKTLCDLRTAIKLCRCHHPLPKFTKISKIRLHFVQQNYHLKHTGYIAPNYLHSKVLGLSILSRSYCTTTSNGLEENDIDNDGLEEILGDEPHEYLENGFNQLKDFLYEHSTGYDELLNKIMNCTSEDDLMRIFKGNDEISRHHAVLSVVRLCHMRNAKAMDETNTKNNDMLEPLLEKILKHASEMNADELSVCFLYLTKLSVKMQTDAMTTTLELFLKLLKTSELGDIPLTALSRFAVAVRINPQLNNYLTSQQTLPHIFHYLDRVVTCEELLLLSICLNNVHNLLFPDTVELFEKKVFQFIADGTLKDDCRTILKILHFFSFPHWSQRHVPLIRELLFQLEDKIPTFNVKELEFVGMIYQINFEPATVGTTIAAYASKLLDRNPTAEVLSCTILHCTPANRQKFVKLAKELVYSNKNPNIRTLKCLFKILRHLKIADQKFWDAYWSKVKNIIECNASQQENHILTKHCYRYMHFNNNLNGTYRHFPFEKTVVRLLAHDLDKGIIALLPSKFAKAAAFILSYGHTPRDKHVFPEFIVNRTEAMHSQFTISDCLQLSRGIQIALEMRYKTDVQGELANQLVRLNNVLNGCVVRHLQQPNLTLKELNSIVRSYTNRKSPMKTAIYQKMIEKYETIPHHHLTSRIIREITFNLNTSKFYLPTLCDSMNAYIVQNHEFVLGDTVQKVLYSFYNLNYHPNDEKIFKCAAEIINRDFDTMSGLSVVEGCLALAFYKELPGSLIDRVFNISFIQRLEDEIEKCYSKDFYPQRVLHSVMQLNRAVCLDFPENGVPWFQQNFVEAQLTRLPASPNKFRNDVKQVLINFTTDESLVKVNHITPYGYQIDFVLYFDKQNKLVTPPTLSDPVRQLNKIAILLLDSDSFCQNDHQTVRGKEVLKQRHLEIMGFKVVQINYSKWNSMYMNLPGAKIDYVKSLLS